MSKPLAQRVTQLEAILRTMIEQAPQAQPGEESYASEAEMVKLAIMKLREARDLLFFANAPRATERVRLALKSAEGAARNADCRPGRHARQEQSTGSSTQA